MKTKLIGMALALMMSSAAAENWKTIGKTQTGIIFEIDLDTIRHNSNGTTVMVGASGGNSTLFFDCQGHYGSSPTDVIHIPNQSIAEVTESVICRRHSQHAEQQDHGMGCTNQKLDARVPLCSELEAK